MELGGRKVVGGGYWVPPEQRDTGMVFQDYALFPHLNVGENVAFGLKKSRIRQNRRLVTEHVKAALVLVGLSGLEKRYPHELSGGQQQ